ncbi:hypothetical protein [Glycomyces arizonensis]|uniref:hypothetical protein n=1 Tax=Glycomyces arizonensis TaxID=256035 RepID=UPI00041A2F0C|nr:hypothetical protein [Glycomyces arizonensis]
MVIRFPIRQPLPPAPPAKTTRTMSEYGPGTKAAKETAEALDNLVDRPDPVRRAGQLRSLAAGLRDPDEARLWREVPLHTAFGDLTFESATRTAAPLQWLHMLRAAFIFLPLLVSWWGIHGAVAAYRERLADNPDQSAQTFFREWLGGFGGELWLSFDRMAMVVVISIVGLIAVSVGIEWLQQRKGNEALELRERLDEALTEAALHLRATPVGTPEDAERQLEQLVRRSDDLIEALLDTARSVQGELSGLTASSGEFRTVITGLEDGAKAVAAATAKLDATVAQEQTRAVQAFHDAGVAAAGEIAAATADLRTGMADQQDRAARILAQVGDAVTEAVAQGERNRDTIGLLMRDNREEDARALAEAIAQRQGELADELKRAGEAIAATLTHAVEVGVDPLLVKRIDAVEQTNRQLNTAVAGLAQSVRDLGGALRTSMPNLPVPQPPSRGLFGLFKR